MKFQGFVGPAYTLKSRNVDCQRAVNIYPEIVESGSGKEGQQLYYKSTPGLRELFEVGDGPIRLIYVDKPGKNDDNPPNRIYIVSGNKLFRTSFVSGAWETPYQVTGEFNTNTGPVRVVGKNQDRVVELMFADGQYLYGYSKVYDPANSLDEETFEEIPPDEEMRGGTSLAWIDGFTIFNSSDSDRFYVSDYGVFGFNALNFASSEGDPDKIVSLVASNRYLWIFNERSVEVWSNTGNSDFPFERISGGFIEKGCLAPYSTSKIDGTVFWLGRDEAGEGVVFAASGFTPQRISTHAIEYAISTYANPEKATSYTYQQGGHSFYVLNFDEATWVYDLSTRLWHERAFTNTDSDLERHRADCVAYSSDVGMHLAGDYETNKIYHLDENYFKDGESVITRLRTSPHVSASGKFIFYHRFILDMQTGIGLVSGQGSNPMVMLTFSNDGGYTWSSESWQSAGTSTGLIGEFTKRVIWNRLGRARDRVFKIKITDPVPVVLLSADLDMEVGNS